MAKTRPERRSRRPKPSQAAVPQLPFQQVINPYSPVEVLSQDQLERIHNASLTVLEEIGVNFLLDEARQILKQAGADVDVEGTRVRFDRNLILEAVSKAPSEFTIHARNPARNLNIGGRWIAFQRSPALRM